MNNQWFKLKFFFKQIKGKIQIKLGKLIHNDFYIVRGRCKELVGKFVKHCDLSYPIKMRNKKL